MTSHQHVGVLGAHWAELVSVALLGTDRRDPPVPPAGPLTEIALEHPPADAAAALVQQVATLTALRRAAGRPAPAPPLLVRPAEDPRPWCPPAAADLLRRVLAEWPVLEDEWLRLAAQGGWRLSPDLVPVLLARHRARAETRPVVERLAGPVAAWLTDLVPGLTASARRSSAGDTTVVLPDELTRVVDADAATVVAVVADGLRRQRYTSPSRAVLVHLIARVRPSELDGIRQRLDHLDPTMTGIGLAYHLADLAATRLAIRHALTPSRLDPVTPEPGDTMTNPETP
jgi:hypothetical protein